MKQQKGRESKGISWKFNNHKEIQKFFIVFYRLKAATKFAYKVREYEASSIATTNTMCIWSVFCHDNADKAMKRMKGREGREEGRKRNFSYPLHLLHGPARPGHNVWRSSVAAGHKSSAKTADCSQKRGEEWGGEGGGSSQRQQQQQRDRYVKWQSNERGRGRDRGDCWQRTWKRAQRS